MRDLIDTVILDKVKRTYPKAKMSLLDTCHTLDTDLGLSSLDVMEVIMECEKKAGIHIPDSEIHDINTKEDIYRLFGEYGD